MDEEVLEDFLDALEWAYAAEVHGVYGIEPDYQLAFDSYGYGRGAKAVLLNVATGSVYSVKRPREDGGWDMFEIEGVEFKCYLTSFKTALLGRDSRKPAFKTLAKMLTSPVLHVAIPGVVGRQFEAVPEQLVLEWSARNGH